MLSFAIISILMTLISRGKTNDFGPFICSYFGSVQYFCREPIVPPKELPTECTSFMWDRMIFGNPEWTLDEHVSRLLAEGNKPVIISMRHNDIIKNYNYLMDGISEQAKQDAEYISTFASKSPNIKGILIDDVELSMFEGNFPTFSKNLNIYMSHLKEKFPCMIFGVCLDAGTVIDMFSIKNEGLDFNTFDRNVDFYLLKFDMFNLCTPYLTKESVIPLSGDLPYTLEKLKQALRISTMPKAKTYFKYELYAFKLTTIIMDYTMQCTQSYLKMCKHTHHSKSWCADNSSTLAEKGKFAFENGAGLSVDSIDFDDSASICKCNKKFPGFYYLLDGWNGQKPVNCTIFDRLEQ